MQHPKNQSSDEEKARGNLVGLLLVLFAFVASMLKPYHKIDPELQPYYNDYMLTVSKYCTENQLHLPNKTSILFGEDLGEGIVGQCVNAMGFWRIRILKSEWERDSVEQKTETIFHELSHCILDKDHVDSPTNYMYNTEVGFIPVDIIREQLLGDAWEHCQK